MLFQGARTTLRCATSKQLALESGQMYRFESKWDRVNQDLDEVLGFKLWNLSEELVGLESSGVISPGDGQNVSNQMNTVFL